MLAKQLGCKQTIARISNTEFVDCKETIRFEELGIDELISPEELAATEIQLLLNKSAFNDTYEFEDGELIMVGVSLPKTAPFVGKMVKEAATIFPELHFMPIAFKTAGTQYTVIPRGDTIFKEGDQVYFITVREGVDELYKLTGKKKEDIRNVMILGGSKVGFKAARDLCAKKFNVKLIEKDKEKAFDLADDLSHGFGDQWRWPKCRTIGGRKPRIDGCFHSCDRKFGNQYYVVFGSKIEAYQEDHSVG